MKFYILAILMLLCQSTALPVPPEQIESVEVFIDGQDIANAAKYIKHKIPEVASDWKHAIKSKLKDKISELVTEKEEPQTQELVTSDLLELLSNGDYKIIKQNGEAEVSTPKPRPKNLKTNPKDLGFKQHVFTEETNSFDLV